MKHLLYLAGPPGVGKSTLVRALAGEDEPSESQRCGVWMLHYRDSGVAELGRRRESFSGTDALGMSVMPAARALVDGSSGCSQPPRLLAEGDRLASLKFLQSARRGSYHVHVVSMILGREELAARRARRQRELGSEPQDAAWVKGRETKSRNLQVAAARLACDAVGARATLLNANRGALELAAWLAARDLVAAALWEPHRGRLAP